MRRHPLPKAFIVFLLLLAAPAYAWAKDSWMSVRSQNFTVVGNASEGDLRKMATKLEQFRYALSLLFPSARIATPVPTTIILFKDQHSFDPFKPKYKGKTKKQIAGYFRGGEDVNYIVLTKELGASNPLEVIFHEYEHFVVHNNINNVPPWLDEGLAEFYSTFEPQSELKVRIGIPIRWHLMFLKSRDILPLKTLLNVDRKSPYYNESDKVGVFYAQSWALVHYLMIGDRGKREGQLTRFIRQMNSGMSPEENFKQSFQADLKTIENELRAYISRFQFTVVDVTFKELDFVKDMQSAPLSEAEADYYLGDLQLHGNELKDAEELLQKSMAMDANLAKSRISMSALRLRQNRSDEARKLAEEAIALDPKNYLGHLYYAEALSEAKKYEEAIKSYKEAALLKPEAWRIHVGLARVYLGMGRDDEASRAFSAALRQDPRNSYINRVYSYTALRMARGYLAAVNAKLYLQREGWRDEHSLYMVLAAHIGYRQSQRADDAARILEDAALKSDTSGWPYPVIEYLQRKLTADALLALATDNDKQTEAHAYIGMDLALNGEREAALTHLRWVKENGNQNFVEYPLALSEINRLEAQPR
ncbi:MAG TPA: tetratricopeptide repeat protein [Pyrinomonadaceae bacterium]|nr:tetratricopeptide repeat protein [Pyrinomonadaceae bacterium]